MKLFVSGTGTGIGKTWVTLGLARALAARGGRVAALKPVETGCSPHAEDARALADAVGRPELASAPGLHRGRLPLAPWSATLAGEPPPPDLPDLVTATLAAIGDCTHALVEGAGGILVPYDADHDFADLATALGFDLLLVAPNRLGTLSHVLTAAECARHRGLEAVAVALTEPTPEPDGTGPTNVRVLEARLRVPVVALPHHPAASALDVEPLLLALDPGKTRI